MQPTNSTKEKRPSFLGEVKRDLFNLIVADLGQEEQEAKVSTDKLWKLFRQTVVNSYYNGVRDGASGKVKPKAPARNRPNN